jgi:hypothetical protein
VNARDNKIPTAPPSDDEKAWDNCREIGDAIAEFASFIASRATLEWEMKSEWREAAHARETLAIEENEEDE